MIGIAAEGFRGTAIDDSMDLWTPLSATHVLIPHLSAGILQDRAAGWIWMFGRLKPGVKIETARADLRTISGQLGEAYPITNKGRVVDVAGGLGMYPDDRADNAGLLGLLAAAVALLMFIACANVAGLFLVRGARRTREIGVRLALGAARSRIIRQLLTEGLLLSVIAGGLGLLLSEWITQAAGAQLASLRRVDLSVDGRVLAFALLASLVTGLLFSLAPALESSKLDLMSALKSGSGAGYRRGRLRAMLVAAQVALSLVLLGASALLGRGLYRIVTAQPGFETTNVAMMSIDMSGLGISQDRGVQIQREILERLRQIPGVVSASMAGTVPPQDFSTRVSIFRPGEEPSPELIHGREFELGLRVDLNSISPGYFATLGIPLLEGRDFTDRDRAVIISRRLAEKLWPGESAIGKRIAWPEWGGPRRPPFDVIGVAADAKYRSLIAEPPLLMYVPGYDARRQVVIRTAFDPASVTGEAARAIHGVDKSIPVINPQTMRAHMAESLWQQRVAASWTAAFSAMALLLAAIGLYGVIAQSVAQRTREVGIRMALGAKPGAIARMMMLEGMKLAAAGTVIGIPAAIAVDRVLPRFVDGVRGDDPAALAAIVVALALVMLLASWLPARRAARVDPQVALRSE